MYYHIDVVTLGTAFDKFVHGSCQASMSCFDNSYSGIVLSIRPASDGDGEAAQHWRVCVRVSMISDWEIDVSHQLSSISFDHVINSFGFRLSPTCSRHCH